MIKIDLNELKELQAKLDQKILENHNVDPDKTIIERILAFQVELGELANETRCFKYWSLKGPSDNDIILEEYVDGIHFLVSLSLIYDLDLVFDIDKSDANLTMQFIDVFTRSSILANIFNKENIIGLFKEYLSLGLSLNFTNEDIINGYKDKNITNHQRQENNY